MHFYFFLFYYLLHFWGEARIARQQADAPGILKHPIPDRDVVFVLSSRNKPGERELWLNSAWSWSLAKQNLAVRFLWEHMQRDPIVSLFAVSRADCFIPVLLHKHKINYWVYKTKRILGKRMSSFALAVFFMINIVCNLICTLSLQNKPDPK